MRLQRMTQIGVLVAVLAVGSSSALASIMTAEFKGTIDSVFAAGSTGAQIGDPWTATYTFESTTPDLNGASNLGDYAVNSVTFDIDGTFLTVDSPLINIEDDSGGRDLYKLGGVLPTDSGTLFEVALLDFDMTVLSDDSLPLTALDLGEFGGGSDLIALTLLNLSFTTYVTGTVDSMTLVPEPASLALLAIGGLALIGRRRR